MSKFIRQLSGKVFIRNTELPVCSKCLHFIEHTNNYPYDPVPSNEQYGKCKKFGEVNMITGIIKYDLASECRLKDNKCGIIGKEYTEKNQYWICEKV
jgi:hypothetical protein